MKLFQEFLSKREKPAKPPPPPPEPRQTVTQDYMEHHGAKPSYIATPSTPPARINRVHPLGGQG